jgi:hypothetical protein
LFRCENVGSCVFQFFHTRSDAFDVFHVLEVIFGVSDCSRSLHVKIQNELPFLMTSMSVANVMAQRRKEHVPFASDFTFSIQLVTPSRHPKLCFVDFEVS